MTNWDDAQFVLALSRTGTIRSAAKNLGVNHATVSRRISNLEHQLKARLFDQTPEGYMLTVSGKIICKAAEQMEDLLLGSHRRIEGSDTTLSGEVHLHIPDAFDEIVCARLAQFQKTYPRVKIQLSSGLSVANLAKREADIALRFTHSPPLDMIGKIVSRMPVAIYASKDFDIKLPTPLSDLDSIKTELSKVSWVRWSRNFAESSIERWVDDNLSKVSVAARVSADRTITNLVRQGVGVAFLSSWFADEDPTLKRLTLDIEDAAMDLWVLTHPDLRGVKRIKAVRDILTGIFIGKEQGQFIDNKTRFNVS